MEYTPGPWEAKNMPSAGWQINARLKSYESRLLRFYETLHAPDLRVSFSGDGLNLTATLGFETWCQFPVDGWEEELAANMHLIAAAPDLLEACKALLVMMDRGASPRKFNEALSWRENDLKARGMALAAITKAVRDT